MTGLNVFRCKRYWLYMSMQIIMSQTRSSFLPGAKKISILFLKLTWVVNTSKKIWILCFPRVETGRMIMF